MAVVATLGEITFTVLENGFRRFTLSSGYGFAQHSKLSGKPTLQQVGDPLDKIKIDFIFHRQLIDVEVQLDQLRTLAETKESQPLVFGELYKGNWIVEQLNEVPRQLQIDAGRTETTILQFSMTLVESALTQIRSQTNVLAIENPFEFFT